jgi:gluconolactonase
MSEHRSAADSASPGSNVAQPELQVICDGLRFPEGPIAMNDGSVILVEMFGPCITRVSPDGTKTKVADVPGGPNGAAIGSDGALYICNNGGCFTPVEMGDMLFPGPFDPARYIGGRIQRLDVATGELTDLYTESGGRALRAPNDLVMDGHGGFWFTDHGTRTEHSADRTAIHYARCDGSSCTPVIEPVDSPNGIGLSPDGTKLYFAETHTSKVFQHTVTGPGQVAPTAPLDLTRCLAGLAGYQLLDSLAVDGAGNVCVATLVNGGITVISPSGEIVEHVPTGDLLTTNICFGGDTAYITCSAQGTLRSMPWRHGGLVLAHTA